MSKKISIVIPTYNHCDDLLKPCIESIVTYTDLSDIEVLVVANGCKDNTKEYVESLGESFKLIWIEEPFGFTKSVNLGINQSVGEYIIILNNDIVLLSQSKNQWIEKLMEPFLSNDKVGITGSKGKICEHTGEWFLIFHCVMIKRTLIEKIGTLDEIFNPGFGEDTDYCIRAKREGFEVKEVTNWHDTRHYAGDFPLYHKAEGTVSGMPTYSKIVERNISILKSKYDKTKVSIVIPTYNHLDDCLRPCIESILKYTDLSNIEVIVSANGCKDDTREYVEGLGKPFRLLWSEASTGFSKAVNDGIQASKGDYVVILNNDTILLNQSKNLWIDMLLAPFDDEKVGITGPILGPSGPAGRDFIIFFCTAIKREVIDKIGLLDLIFTPGGGEDTDFCIRAEDAGYKLVQVPRKEKLASGDGFMIGGFPIYHKGEATVHDTKCVENWQSIFDRNSTILAEKYNHQWKLGNYCERAVIGKDDPVPPREHTRYKWARENIVGTKILEIGCSSGYGFRYFQDIPNVDYLGIDKDEPVIKFAKDHFGNRFQVADINTFNFGQYDTIIAFEVLEHLENGKQIAQKLKKHCKCLLATCPYGEIEGLFGKHHKLYGLKETDFSGFRVKYVRENGEIADFPDRLDGMNLLLMKWTSNSVTAVISTKGRYHSTLPQAILSVANQSHKVDRLIIFDDGEQKDLRNDILYKHTFSMLNMKGIQWQIVFGERKGQVLNHQKSINMCQTEWIWRLDDDNVAEYDVLEKLLSVADDKTGAVGGLAIDPTIYPYSRLASNKIEDIYLGLNIQWFAHDSISEVDHLYSTFIYRKSAAKHGYCMELSVVGHREETIFTYEMKRAGWKLLVNPYARTWHFRNAEGGIRSFHDGELWHHDELIFGRKMNEWGVKPNTPQLVVLDSGLGDHLVFKSILSDLKKRYANLILAVCYPDVFVEDDVKMISIAEAKAMTDISKHNIYKFMWDRGWQDSLEKAYRQLYGV